MHFRLLFIRYRTIVPRVFSLFVYRGKERTLVMRSSHAALTDSRSSVSRVVQRNLVSVTFPFPSLFSLGKVLGTRLYAALLPKGGALHYETKNIRQKYFPGLLSSRKWIFNSSNYNFFRSLQLSNGLMFCFVQSVQTKQNLSLSSLLEPFLFFPRYQWVHRWNTWLQSRCSMRQFDRILQLHL